MIDLNRLYNDAEPLVRGQIIHWLENNRLEIPKPIELDQLTHAISTAFAMQIQAQERETSKPL